ncbi:MAG TPA: MFS transporter, partial [candidate division Zixibacteria bacterium]|nr:MFS transporter [candidate division Zixibacteria bacterium]
MHSKWKMFAVAATGILLSTIDSSALGVALPIVSADFGISVQNASWVVTTYQLTLTSLVLTAARLSEAWGFRQAYFLGYGLFFAGSLFSTFSFNLVSLILARLLQALGAAFLLAVNPALIVSAFGPKERGKGLGMIGGTVGLGLILGPLVGGVLTGYLGWRSIFWTNLPISIFGILAARKIIPHQESRKAVLGWANFFWVSVVYCFLTFMSTFMSTLPQLGSHFSSYLLAAGFLVSLLLFLYFEKGERPLVGIDLYRRTTFSLGILGLFLCYAGLFSATFLVPFYLHQVLGEDAFSMGRIMSSIPLAVMLVAPAAGRLSDRLGNRWISAVGLMLSAAGIFSLILLESTSSPFQVVESLSLIGIGTALFQSPNSSSIMASVPEKRLATAAGMIATIRNLGMAFGVAFGSTLFAFWQRKYAALPVEASFMESFHNVFKVTGWLVVLGIFTS